MPAPAPAATGYSRTDLSPAAGSLLAVLDSKRELLARRLVAEHHAIAEPDLNSTILHAILGVLFLKTGEECGFAGPGTLDLLLTSDGIDRRLLRACADVGLDPDVLFETHPVGPGPAPFVPDEAIRELIRTVQSPELPALLSAIPLHELAAIFEQYLGTTMRIAEGYRVKHEGKSAVRYTGSVHVTPQPVVQYMVHETLGSVGRIPGGSGSATRILDPACGAGIFLLAAYRFLVRQNIARPGLWQQAPDVPRKILCRSVFGTDIDPESVAAARFILLLACIEESSVSGSGPATAARIRQVAECLQRTIRCGNALIAPDYFSGRQVHPFNAGERSKVNPFDWQEEFMEIMAAGGFDAVIGAPPPYRPFTIKARDEYFQTHYETYAERAGLYGYFIEKGLSLLRPEGRLSFLIPDTFLRQQHARPFRRLLLSNQILGITGTGMSRMLQDTEATMLVLKLMKNPAARPFAVSQLDIASGRAPGTVTVSGRFTVDQRSLGDGGWTLEDRRATDLLDKLRHSGTPLDTYVMGEIQSGRHRIRNNPLVIDSEVKKRLIGKDRQCRRFFIPLLRPAEIRRYVPVRPERHVISVRNIHGLKKCRTLQEYLESVAGRPDAGPGLGGSQEITGPHAENILPEPVPFLSVPKIIFAEYQHCPAFTFDRTGSYAIVTSLLAISRNDPYLAAILNSSLGRFLITGNCTLTDRGYHISPARLGKFSVITPDFDKLPDKIRHDKIVALVTQIFSLHEYFRKAKTDQERRLVQQEIEATDVKIDALVYELYGLSAEEIAVVGESSMR